MARTASRIATFLIGIGLAALFLMCCPRDGIKGMELIFWRKFGE